MKKSPPRLVPCWDDYYMGLTYIIASRSKDPSTQVGSIVVNNDNLPLGMGYNGAPQLIPDQEINWKRPDKYVFIEHAEVNAIDHAMDHTNSLSGCTIYVSATPCPDCMRRIVKRRIRRVVYGKTLINMIDEESLAKSCEMAKLGGVRLEMHTGNLNWIRDRLDWLEENLPQMF